MAYFKTGGGYIGKCPKKSIVVPMPPTWIDVIVLVSDKDLYMNRLAQPLLFERRFTPDTHVEYYVLKLQCIDEYKALLGL